MLSESLLASVYAIATEEHGFQQASSDIASELGYRHGLISLRSPERLIEIALNQAPEIMTGYQEHYYKLDPWSTLIDNARFGEVITSDPEVDRKFYDTEFYVDFAYRIGLVDPLGVRMPVGAGMELVLGVNQPLHSRRPTDEDIARMRELGRHVQRAVQLRQQLRGAVEDRGTLLLALDRVAFGMAVTSADGRVHALNTAGEAAITQGCGLQVRNGVLTARDSAMAGPLALLIRDASNGGPGGALRLRAGLDEFANILVTPLPSSAGGPGNGTRSLVAFRLSGAPTHLSAQMLMSVVGLSRGEAQVAMALMEGKSSEEIALARAVKATTIKSQLQSIFLKTGTNSQRELVRYLSGLPALRMD